MSEARHEILRRVRSALHDRAPDEGPDDVAVARDYRTDFGGDREELVERFAERVADYRATVRRVRGESELAEVLARACREHGARRLVVPRELPPQWRPDAVGVVEDDALSAAELDGFDGVLTGCALGIAETGTIVLDGGARSGRRAISLVPDLHLCVVFAHQVVGRVPEAVAELAATVRGEGRPVTFISGPSATSDIELDRVEGVHGPRTLDVLIVG